MMRRIRFGFLAFALIAGQVLALGPTALADHTNPRTPLAPTEGASAPTLVTRGAGSWSFIKNFPANPGTDQETFTKGGAVYVSSGTLGQGSAGHVGQRVVRLTDEAGNVAPRWVADHGSAACPTVNPTGTTGLQHDTQIAGSRVGSAELIVDTTDATGRCHDPNGGGLEFIDISRLDDDSFLPREVHITRHAGFSHTVTVDATRPWIVYNSSSDFSGRPWIDVLDVKSCVGFTSSATLQQKRATCRPKVYRIPFQPDWSRQRASDGSLVAGSEAACHDITARPGRIYCAGLNATLIFDVSKLTTGNGAVRGTPLSCNLADVTMSGAKVTDCSGAGANATQLAAGWKFLGTFNHPGRNPTNTNTNLEVRSDEGVAVSHEADPSPDGHYMFVTDERGGGVVPPGASCSPGIENPYGNGGIHVFDISNPSNIRYALQPDGSKAVWISDAIVPAATFCTVHVIEHIPDEQRIMVAYYSQGVKVLDYFVDSDGRFQFRETASLVLPGSNTWAFEHFKIQDNADGTRTYHFVASDIQRGIDVLSWTGPKNPMGASHPDGGLAVPGPGSSAPGADESLVALALVLLPAALWLGRRRRTVGRLGWSMLLKP
jgi:hypothetical protein